MEKVPLKELLDKYNAGNCTEQERVWVENWYIQHQESTPFSISETDFEHDMNEVYSRLPDEEGPPIRQKSWRGMAAVVIGGLLIAGISVYLQQRALPEQKVSSSMLHDLEPGTNTAMLRLADNSVIHLDSLTVGESYQYAGFRIRKTESGVIEYLSSPGEPPSEGAQLYNEISTPNGGQYQVLLPDGSKVWLNASSTLKYPIQFSSHERLVELSGEGYFEVKKNSVPFYVQTKQQRVEVLGTHFNVNAYENQREVKTTLLEGSVKVIVKKDQYDEGNARVLRPGEQSILTGTGVRIKSVDVAHAIAWKNGFFSFQDTDIVEVMQEFSRWYNVDVKFVGSMPNTTLWGEIYRNVNASEALQILEYFDMKFKIVTDNEISRIEISKK